MYVHIFSLSKKTRGDASCITPEIEANYLTNSKLMHDASPWEESKKTRVMHDASPLKCEPFAVFKLSSSIRL
jgi:hypothetical protein